MMSTLTAATSAVGEAWLGSEQSPTTTKASSATAMTSRDEPAGDLIGKPLDRCARALRFGDHLNDLRKHSVAADLLGAHDEAAGPFSVPPMTFAPGSLVDRHRFAGHHRFVE